MIDVIAYSRKDRPRIEKLSRALEAQGVNVWPDKHITARQTAAGGGYRPSTTVKYSLNA